MKKSTMFRSSIIYEILLLIIGLFGVLIQLGIFEGNINYSILNYYTILSNIFCIIYIFIKIIYKLKNTNKEFQSRFKGSVIMCITVTMIVYHFLLSGAFTMIEEISKTFVISNYILHYIVPLMIILDWLIFDKKGSFKFKDIFTWLIIPLVYFAYALVIGHFQLVTFYGPSFYPYYFIDVDNIGFLRVFFNAFLITLFFFALGLLIYYIDKKLIKK